MTDLHHRLADLDLRQCLEQSLATGEPPQVTVHRRDGSRHYLMGLLPYTGEAKEVGGVVMTFVDVTALTRADARHKTMIGELNHRVRNMLAVVSAMASQTLVRKVPAEALDGYLGRLHAMSRTYKLLTEAEWSSMALRDIVLGELGAVTCNARFSLQGRDVQLEPREALILGMVIHELTTNAIKYDALSNSHGRIDVTWEHGEGDDAMLGIHWCERDGPSPTPPEQRSFGTVLMERQLAYELNGRSELDYAPDGFKATLHIPHRPCAERST